MLNIFWNAPAKPAGAFFVATAAHPAREGGTGEDKDGGVAQG